MVYRKTLIVDILVCFGAIFFGLVVQCLEGQTTEEDHLRYPVRQSTSVFCLGRGMPIPVVICSGKFMPTAMKLKKALEHHGCGEVPILLDSQAVRAHCRGLLPKWKFTPVILLGNLEQNQALFQLYSRFLTNADARTPGVGGSLVQVIPNRNSPGSHALLVAGSTIVDTKRVIGDLTARLAALPPGKCDLASMQTNAFFGAAEADLKVAQKTVKHLPSAKKTWKSFLPLAEA